MAIEFDGRVIETDDEGYLSHIEDYSPALRDFMAKKMGLVLSFEHIFIIETVRKYYNEYNTTPTMRGLIKLLQRSDHSELASSVKLARLFPDGAAKNSAKLAGLPKPVKCI